MTSFSENILIRFEALSCATCGVLFGLTSELNSQRLNNGGTFYCSNGHAQSYAQPLWKKYKEELEQAQNQLRSAKCDALSEKLQKEAAQKENNRIKKRISAGVCTCCNRTFQNLAKHMKAKHAVNQAKL